MDHYEVRFTVRLPAGVAATQAEAKAWLRFYLRDNGSLDGKNPLSDQEPEPLRGTFRIFPTAGYAAVGGYKPRLTPVGDGDGNTFAVG